MLETLNYIIRIDSTPTFLYFIVSNRPFAQRHSMELGDYNYIYQNALPVS